MTSGQLISLLIAAVFGSAGVTGFIQFLITRRDSRKGDLQKILNKLDALDRSTTRTQMLLLMKEYPGKEEELMKVAEHYFKDLEGNWYMSSLFNEWLQSENHATPSWFKK